ETPRRRNCSPALRLSGVLETEGPLVIQQQTGKRQEKRANAKSHNGLLPSHPHDTIEQRVSSVRAFRQCLDLARKVVDLAHIETVEDAPEARVDFLPVLVQPFQFEAAISTMHERIVLMRGLNDPLCRGPIAVRRISGSSLPRPWGGRIVQGSIRASSVPQDRWAAR